MACAANVEQTTENKQRGMKGRDPHWYSNFIFPSHSNPEPLPPSSHKKPPPIRQPRNETKREARPPPPLVSPPHHRQRAHALAGEREEHQEGQAPQWRLDGFTGGERF